MPGRGSGSTYAESTKLLIVRSVLGQPGRTGKQIAQSLGLDRSRVNSFLYGEGKRRFGLVSSSWCWYAAQSIGTKSRPASVASRRSGYRREAGPISEGLCVILSRMSITDATLKIRGMSLTLVELVFAEDEYPMLDERLQVELIMRKRSLEVASQEVRVVKQERGRWFWALVIVLGAWMLNLLMNQRPAEYENQLRRGGGMEQVAPGQ